MGKREFVHVNGGAIPGQRGGVKAGHKREMGATWERARSGPFRHSVGHDPKLAITAVMRKLIIFANALIKANRKWIPKTA